MIDSLVKTMLFAFHLISFLILCLWVILTISNLLRGDQSGVNWLSVDTLLSFFYSGIPFLITLIYLYVSYFLSDVNINTPRVLSIYFMCILTFFIMLLSHIANPFFTYGFFIAHILSLTILNYLITSFR